tara:strand:+ start:16766 stop:16939 length:174 start_codon:yes stop_codon:yes gene_type:complete
MISTCLAALEMYLSPPTTQSVLTQKVYAAQLKVSSAQPTLFFYYPWIPVSKSHLKDY